MRLLAIPMPKTKMQCQTPITRRGKPVLAVMHWELYDAIAETLEVMGDKEFREQLRQSIKEMDKGKAISWDEAKLELRL
jgi:antitoxin YefM